MATKRIGCRSCSHYSGSLGRCRLGKVNPMTYIQAEKACYAMGIDYICNKNGMKDKLIDAYGTSRYGV